MKSNYEGGNYGYGHAKQALYELICDKFKNERERFNHYMDNITELDEQLKVGADKAREVAKEVLKRVREKLGY
jgi:tryptophanyl-tRNA synthetase